MKSSKIKSFLRNNIYLFPILKFIIDNIDRQLLLRIWNRGLEYKNYYPEYYYDDIHSIYETPGSLYNRSVILENRAGKRRTRKRRTRSR